MKDATVEVRSRTGIVLYTKRTDADGRFESRGVLYGYLLLRVTSEGFAERETFLYLNQDTGPIRITLEPASVFTRVTVNATRGGPRKKRRIPRMSWSSRIPPTS